MAKPGRPPLDPAEKKRRQIEKYVGKILDVLVDGNEDAKSQALLDLEGTPERVSRMLVHETISYPKRPRIKVTALEEPGDVLGIGPIGYASTCAHHLLPFTGHAWIAYLADKRLLGLSKFSRIVRYCSKRLQLQERLTQQVRNELVQILDPEALLVVMKAEHGCISCRGVEDPSMRTVTASLYGDDTHDTSIIDELYKVIDRCGG